MMWIKKIDRKFQASNNIGIFHSQTFFTNSIPFISEPSCTKPAWFILSEVEGLGGTSVNSAEL